MAKMTTSQKCAKLLRFLEGVAKPRAAMPLAAFGFKQGDLDEGWKRLHAAAGDKLLIVPETKPDPTKLKLLDDWENTWFPVADATLKHRFPAVREKVFLNLSQQTGLDVLISVKTLVARIDELEAGSAEEQAARAMLEERGLNAETMNEAKDLLSKVATIQVVEPVMPDPAAAEAAEKHMWAWYLEWSTIARTAIKDRRVLRSLGFLRPQIGGGPDEDVMDDEPLDDDIVEEPVPVPV